MYAGKRVCQFSTQTACWGQVTIPLMWQISPGITFLSAVCHLVRSGRRAAKGQVSTVSLLICRMKHGVGESMSTSGVQQAKPRPVQVSQADVIGSFYVAVGTSIMLYLAEIWHCRRRKSWIIMFEGVPWKWKKLWLNNKWTLIWGKNELFLCCGISSTILMHFFSIFCLGIL